MKGSIHQTKDIYRDSCRRSHRILGAYLALWAWRKGTDGVVLDRDQSFRYLGLEAMREQRLQWLKEDIADFFPHQEVLHVTPTATIAATAVSWMARALQGLRTLPLCHAPPARRTKGAQAAKRSGTRAQRVSYLSSTQ